MKLPSRYVSALSLVLGWSLSPSRASADETHAVAPEPSASPPSETTTRSEPDVASDAPGSAAPAPRAKPKPVVGLRIDGGYAMREVVALPLSGAGVGLAAGAQLSRSIALWGTSRLFIGSSSSGLDVRSMSFGGEAEAVLLDRLRFGAGLHGFLLGVDRVTRNKMILSWGPAVSASARVDLIQADGFALFARAAIDAGYEIYNGSVFWGPTFGAGVDLDLHGARATLH